MKLKCSWPRFKRPCFTSHRCISFLRDPDGTLPTLDDERPTMTRLAIDGVGTSDRWNDGCRRSFWGIQFHLKLARSGIVTPGGFDDAFRSG